MGQDAPRINGERAGKKKIFAGYLAQNECRNLFVQIAKSLLRPTGALFFQRFR
jgi:hypothetical protein